MQCNAMFIPVSRRVKAITAYTLLWDKGLAKAEPAEFEQLYCGPEKRFKVSNLEPGRAYRLCVAATNAVGRGGTSALTTFSTQAGAG